MGLNNSGGLRKLTLTSEPNSKSTFLHDKAVRTVALDPRRFLTPRAPDRRKSAAAGDAGAVIPFQ